ncbi:response regulator [Candidatus Aerophobetes bacterium]|nr:response regulator [Candidatus Aerophobetes bacterium]
MKKILLIDDDVDFVYLNKVYLEKKGYRVLTAYDGKEGLEVAKKENPDVIILDVMMTTKTEGFDVARKIKRENSLKNIPVIMLTAIRKKERLPWTFEPDEEWLPVTEFLEKPFSPEKLYEKIENILKQGKNAGKRENSCGG